MIYAVTSDLGYVKIGITRQNIKRRVLELQTGHPEKIRIAVTWDLGNRILESQAEDRLHKQLARYRVSGEWFKLPIRGIVWLYETSNEYLLLGCTKEKDFSVRVYPQEKSPARRKQIDEIIEFNSDEIQHWWESNENPSDGDKGWLGDEISNTSDKWCDRMLETLYCDMESDDQGIYSCNPYEWLDPKDVEFRPVLAP